MAQTNLKTSSSGVKYTTSAIAASGVYNLSDLTGQFRVARDGITRPTTIGYRIEQNAATSACKIQGRVHPDAAWENLGSTAGDAGTAAYSGTISVAQYNQFRVNVTAWASTATKVFLHAY